MQQIVIRSDKSILGEDKFGHSNAGLHSGFTSGVETVRQDLNLHTAVLLGIFYTL